MMILEGQINLLFHLKGNQERKKREERKSCNKSSTSDFLVETKSIKEMKA